MDTNDADDSTTRIIGTDCLHQQAIVAGPLM